MRAARWRCRCHATATAFNQVAAKHGAVASDDGLLIPMPQQTRGDALVDTIDRVQIGAELLRSLTGAGSNSTTPRTQKLTATIQEDVNAYLIRMNSPPLAP